MSGSTLGLLRFIGRRVARVGGEEAEQSVSLAAMGCSYEFSLNVQRGESERESS